jgi:signal transduction histidine kinase
VSLCVTVAALVALATAGGLAWGDRATGASGTVTLVAAASWVAPVWVGWVGGPPLVRSLGLVLAPLLVPALVHLFLAEASSRPSTTRTRVVCRAAWVVAAGYGLGRAAVRDPLLDPYCWSNCTDNVFLVRSSPVLARVLDTGWSWSVVGVAVLAVLVSVVLVFVLPSGGRSTPGRAWPVSAAAAAALGTEVAYALALLRQPAESPAAAPFRILYLARGTALVLLAAAVGCVVLRVRRRRAAVTRVAEELTRASEPGSLENVLRRAMDDADLHVGYWRRTAGHYVDADGGPWTAIAAPGAEAVSITFEGRPLAMVVSTRGRAGAGELRERLGAAARLAVDNERLRAEALAELADLRASRVRIVQSADAARRRLERDLHDGAQQRLLALVYELRLARAEAAEPDGGPLHALEDEAAEVVGELRELAHGIFPAVLEDGGLEPALEGLADRAGAPVTIAVTGEPPAPVARVVYLLAQSAIDAAEGTPVRVSVVCRAGTMLLEVEGAVPADLTHCADRVGALGGNLTTGSRRLTAEVPCA